MHSCAAIVVALYSAYVLDNETVSCLLLHQEIAPKPKLNTYPVVDLQVSRSPA